MADIRCTSCGRDNPDFLDVCQFCQNPLKPEAMVHTGEKPTKKNTGELEGVLPEWLRDARQQARDSAEEDAAQAATQPKIQKVEPPDLLAGLAFQASSADDEEVPDWLSSINPIAKQTPAAASSAPEPETDFFAQFNKSEPVKDDAPSWMSGTVEQPQASSEKDDLSAWFSQTSEQPLETFSLEPDPSSIDSGWMPNADLSAATAETPAPKEKEEDLGWLHNLEATSKQTDELKTPKQDSGWMASFDKPSSSQPEQEDLSWLNDLGAPQTSQPPASQTPDDLSWLNTLGGASEPAQSDVKQPAESPDDLSWLNNFGGASEPAQTIPSQPSESKDDLSWLNNFTAASEPVSEKPSESPDDLDWLSNLGGTAEPAQPPVSQPQDLGWLNNFASTPEPAQPASPASDDLSWLSNFQQSTEPASSAPLESTPEPEKTTDDQFGTPPISPYSPSRTAPLTPGAEINSMPDWLRDATQSPSMPLGMNTLDQFRDDHTIRPAADEPFSWKSFTGEAESADEESLPSQPEPAFVDPTLSVPAGDSASLSNQDVDSLFSMQMPDWLSQEPETVDDSSQQTAIHTEDADALAPVDLPSWVQAMRPMEAVISDATSSIDDQPTEREGPLAGLKGVIPFAPIGSSQRPKAISLKLQASAEQQASATVLEQLLASETSPRVLIATSVATSQHILRWALGGLFLIVLGVMIGLRTQIMPVSAALPVEMREVTSVVMGIPDNSQVLVVMDYEPALAGEMEATSGPLLDQLVLLRHPRLSFVSTSPNGSALVERLMTDTNINKASPAGLGYLAGENYFNLGYLPGGESGVLAFVQSPQVAIPSASARTLSEFAAVIVLTDHAESARVWVEQIQSVKQADPALANQPLLMVSSAQAGPLLQPYVASRQITGMLSGLADGARYEFINNSRPGIARSYWDAFGVGLMMAIVLIVAGSLWSLFMGMRARRAEAEQG